MTAETGYLARQPNGTSPTRPSGRLVRLAASPAFQAWAARMPFLRRFVRREGEAMFDLVAGFCHSQVLQAFVGLDLHESLVAQEQTLPMLSRACDVPPDRLEILLNAAAAIGLVRRRPTGHYRLTVRSAALGAVPGLPQMIRHHAVLYRDLADPVAFFRGPVSTELAAFWPYVFGAGAATDPETARTYSSLMSESQTLVAADTLATGALNGARHLMDVGGGSGAFLCAAARAYPSLQMTLFDLPQVVPAATAGLIGVGCADRARVIAGSFRDDPLPIGADAVSLVRVLYDHADDTVAALLSAVFEVLPPGGRVIVSEPMTGGATPTRPGDAYFALYCMAMQTGRARSAATIAALLRSAGFDRVSLPISPRPFVTSVVMAAKPA